MREMKRPLLYVLVLVGGLMCVGDIARAATSAEKSLEKGIEAFRKNDTDKAMDYFVDVLMNGTAAQQARANNYIDAIHNKIGGIETPVEVDLKFPEQPTQTVVDPANNLANFGTERLNTLATQADVATQEVVDAFGEAPRTLTEQIEARQLDGYVIDEEPQKTVPATTVEPVNMLEPIQPQPIQMVQPVQTVQPVAQTPVVTPVAAPADLIPTQQEIDALEAPTTTIGVPAPRERSMSDELVTPLTTTTQPTAYVIPTTTTEQPVAYVPVTYTEPVAYAAAPVDTTEPTTTYAVPTTYTVPTTQAQLTSSTFADLTSPEAIQARNLYTAQKIQSMTQEAETALRNTPGVHLYLREDGRPDAIDVDDDVLFKGNYFRSDSLDTLNYIYELLALTQGASYTILPSGSYTDDVTLAKIRQAMALKSYLVKRGISEGKLSYNMGLANEEIPAKFSNLKGLSVVFDYDAKLPTRLLDNEEKQTTPLLSMAIVPPCRAIDRSLGEAYAIDFSVLETETPLDNWVLQVIWHGRDGKFYVVRQLEGFSPVYHQILWNGRKGIIGPELPCGKYTLVLTGIDLKGQKQVLRYRVIVKCAQEVATTGSCQEGKCAITTTATAKTVAAKSAVLDYKSARLWKKPGRIMRDGKIQETAAVKENVEETVQVQADAHSEGSAQSTRDDTYTHTKTVRTIVTDDTSSAGTVTSSSSSSSSYSDGVTDVQNVSANPYEMPYEEEYTSF